MQNIEITKQMKKWLALPVFCLVAACGADETASPISGGGNQATGEQIQLKLNNIEPTRGQHYEGWAVGSNGVTSTGRFNINDQGQIVAVNAEGEVLSVLSESDEASFSLDDDPSTLQAFVLTIEPDGDTDPGPSAIHYLEGSFEDSVAMAQLQAPGAVGASFIDSIGTYILATPTNGPSTHNQGIWYVDNGNPSLELPTLPETFAYEGWIVNTQTGEVFSTGVFDQASGADSDGAGMAKGPNAAPPFPGQDYIDPAMILNDGIHRAVISVEPVPDFDPAPFTLKILAATIANGAAVTTSFSLENISNENEISIRAQVNP